ncbi:MAG: hypothetical protein MMC23_000035 [Stictis urceolatum]|nr:hypothetical protein [Stictis urceolata]
MATGTQTETSTGIQYDLEYGALGPETPVVESYPQTPGAISSRASIDQPMLARISRPDDEVARHLGPAQEDNVGNNLTRQRSNRERDPADDLELLSLEGTCHSSRYEQAVATSSALGSELIRKTSHRPEDDPNALGRQPTGLQNITPGSLELGPPGPGPTVQSRPPEFQSMAAEIIFILVCSSGQLMFAFLLGDIIVNINTFLPALGLKSSEAPWLLGSTLLANGLSVVISGSLADLAGPRSMIIFAFTWMTIWHIIGVFSIRPSWKIIFFIVRAMQGLSVGVLVSASMSILGRVYKPGLRKTRVFSCMAAMAPFGFWVGGLQGGALSGHLPWIFGSSAMLSGIFCVAAILTVPKLAPAQDSADSKPPSMKDFDYAGAGSAMAGCACVLFGLTQGSPTNWDPYTYTLIVVGLLFLVAFYFIERRSSRPLIPNNLWQTPGFLPLLISFGLGFGSFIGACQFYAVRFWLSIQGASPFTVALYLIPNAVFGVIATWVVSQLLHRVAGHWILAASMFAVALGPALFLPQTAGTSYFALSMPAIGLATFGPDMMFASASIFITSSVKRSYQGSAGSLLVTTQNVASAIMTAVADSIGSKVTKRDGELDLEALRAIWWFSLATSICAAAICIVGVRMPKSEEKEHVA